ncbi:Protein phosphatase 2C [Phytophthora megakarya]|uniref:Protein phosphatase 2C n=1 Tax=Phytophthora megakarya TaxID=4795 RepID=A0A225WP84_9STRA|nr:Protein phosphatase 2C [Phytophthora megakarya]
MGCILTKVCDEGAVIAFSLVSLYTVLTTTALPLDLLMLGDDVQDPPPQSRRLSRSKATLLMLGPSEISLSNKTQEADTETKSGLVVYGGGVPGVALDADRVELPEFTGIRDGGYSSTTGRLRWGLRSRAGDDPLRRRKENQDALCVCDAMADDQDASFFSVLDGHGPQGAFVSHFVREKYHQAVAEAYAELIPCASNGASVLTRKASVTCDVVSEIFHQAARTVVGQLDASTIDVSVSGTTAVAMLVRKNDVFIANIGDSRAAIARFADEEQRYVLHCETKDHKPDVPEECARIERNNGRVFEWGSYRVWLQDVDMPGLAMSRSFGDSVAKTVGVTAEPDVTIVEKLKFSTDKKNGERPPAFAVLASDGIWEFMTTDECIDFVAACIIDSGMSPQEVCTALVEEACDRWDAEEDVIDDITAAVVFF